MPEQKYFATNVINFKNNTMLDVEEVIVNAPAPGTPRDSLYNYPTVACTDTGYEYKVATDIYSLPLTVHRPYFEPIAPITAKADDEISFKLTIRNPASDISDMADDGVVYNEMVHTNYCVGGIQELLDISAEDLPEGATFNKDTLTFYWKPNATQLGEYDITFIVDDAYIEERMLLKLCIENGQI
jgi:hypothetical protein